jgi:hypothetical protein
MVQFLLACSVIKKTEETNLKNSSGLSKRLGLGLELEIELGSAEA